MQTGVQKNSPKKGKTKIKGSLKKKKPKKKVTTDLGESSSKDDKKVVHYTGETKVYDVSKGYDLWAQIYDSEDNPLIALEEARYPTKKVSPYVKGGIAIDIGCGTGRNIARLLTFDPSEVIGLDISPGMLEKAGERFQGESRVTLKECNLKGQFPGIKENSINIVTACLMLEHITLDALPALFSEIHRILKPGGCVMITEMHPWLWELGGQAQFTDPNGAHIIVKSYRKTVADYLMAAIQGGLELKYIHEQEMDTKVGESGSRAAAFTNQPMLLWYMMEKPVDEDVEEKTNQPENELSGDDNG